MQPFSGNQHPGLLTSLMNMSLVLRLPREMHLCRSSSNVPHLPMLLKLLHPHVLLTFDKVQNPLRRPRETTCERPKVVRTCSAFNILSWKCALHHNGIHFFDISTSKSGLRPKCASRHNGMHFFIISTSRSAPRMVCFVHFDLEMCFAPQLCELVHHLNFQKWSETVSFLHF